MTPNNRPIWIVIALLAAALLMLKIPAGWQGGEEWMAAAVEGPAQGLEAPAAGAADTAMERWLRERELQKEADQRLERRVRLGLGALFSMVILWATFRIALRKGSTAAERNWAFGTIGGILGYWLGR